MNQKNRYEWSFTLKFIILFRTTVLRKLFDITFWHKHCNFSCGCLLVNSRWLPKPWRGLYLNLAVSDPGEGPKGPGPPLFLDQTEAWRAEKFFLRPTPPFLRAWMTPPPYLKVWICHCLAKGYLSTGHSTITYIRYLSKLTWSRFRW